MKNKLYSDIDAAVADIPDGATLLLGGFGAAGNPGNLINAVVRRAPRQLTIVTNNVGLYDANDLLCREGLVRKVIASFPVRASARVPSALERGFREGRIEVEIVPQGTMAERLRAAGAGLGGFYTPTGVGTIVEQGKERRTINGKDYLFELPLWGDFALIKAHKADRLGNLVYRLAARNFNPVMATAASTVIVEVDAIVEAGELDPELIVTPHLYVDRIVQAERYPPILPPN